MDNITTGHWIFALIFALTFIGFLVWSYVKDMKMHRTHYPKSWLILLSLILIIFLIFVFKEKFQ